ncbi:hypothetical protein JJB09_06630 [Rhizobium sp. KVB221]|uniref:Uncharacterized protein n=1 Tax=Rhizobium setariae TaxID=2801340 RepID=A0A936YK49_9HYPH|nr:hypothetical protein [Rhizobium setariae]MBL0371698.1 hypothetical protein [Rhizobium setariae]
MKRIGVIMLLVSAALSMGIGDSDAAWKKRGWYVKKEGENCVMRKVTVVGADGKLVVQKIRVCG